MIKVASIRTGIPITATQQTITIPNIGNPKAAIFILNRCPSGTTIASSAAFNIGFANDTNQLFHAINCEDNVGTSDTHRMSYDSLCMVMLNSTDGTEDCRASFVEWVEDGVTIDWVIAPSDDFTLTTILFAGDVSELNTYIGTFTTPEALNSGVIVSGVGFEPDQIIGIGGGGPNGFDLSTRAGACFSFGMCDNNNGIIKQGSINYCNLDNLADTSIKSLVSQTYFARDFSGDFGAVELGDFNSSGFTATARISGVGMTMGFLALKYNGNVKHDVGFISSPSFATGIQTISGVGFGPQFISELQTTCTAYDTQTTNVDAGSMGIATFGSGLTIPKSFQMNHNIRSQTGAATSNEDSRTFDNTTFLRRSDESLSIAITSTLNSVYYDGYSKNFSSNMGNRRWINLLIGNPISSSGIDFYINGYNIDTNNLDLFIVGHESLIYSRSDVYYAYTNDSNGLIKKSDLDFNNITILTSGAPATSGESDHLDIDEINDKLYFVQDNPSTDLLRRYDLNTGTIENLTSGQISHISLDSIHNRIYGLNFLNDAVLYTDLNGQNGIVITSGSPFSLNPIDTDIDLINSKIYWIDREVGHKAVVRSNLDGSNIENVITGLSGSLRSLAVDHENNQIFWGLDTPFSGATLLKATTSGTNIQIITGSGLGFKGLDIDYINQRLYALDEQLGQIVRVGLIDNSIDSFQFPLSGVEALNNIAIDQRIYKSLFVHGFETINDNCNLFIWGHQSSTDDVNFFINGHILLNGDIDLFVSGITGATLFNSDVDLFVNGHVLFNNNIDLFIRGYATFSTDIDLYINGHQSFNNDIDLFIFGIGFITNDITLFISSINTSANGIDLFIYGVDSNSNDIDLMIVGSQSLSNNLHLIILGKDSNSDDCDLFVHGKDSITNSIDLIIVGEESFNNECNLFIYGHVSINTTILAWGNNVNGQIDVPIPNSDFVLVKAYNHNLGIKTNGSITAWGRNDFGQSDVPEPNTDFIDVATGSSHSLGLKSNGSIVSWGRNNFGQLNVPAPNTNFIAVEAGGNHSLGLKSDGSIVAWGDNSLGQCTVPSGNSGYIAISAGSLYSLGLKADGSIVGWGYNGFGQITIPTPNNNFIAISAGNNHVLGLKTDGSIVAWGDNFEGEIDVPLPNDNFTKISAGAEHSLGLKNDGSIIGWGKSSAGQITIPSPNTRFIGVEAGANHSLGISAPIISLFINGMDLQVDSIDLSISGSQIFTYNNNIDLFIRSTDIVTSGIDLIIFGPIFINDSIDLFIKVIEVNNLDLYIKGIQIPNNIACPSLDLTLPIQISSDLIEIYQSRIDSLINQLGKNVLLEFNPIIQPCTNCEFDVISGKSKGIYRTGGSIPFARGQKCPYCKGAGFLEQSVYKCIKCLTQWNPKDAENYGISVDDPASIVRLKGFLTDGDDMVRAKAAITNHDIENVTKFRVKLIRGPVIVGLRESRYIITFWKLLDS